MPQAGFEPVIPANQRGQTYALRPRGYRNLPSQDYPTKIMYALCSVSAHVTNPLHPFSLHRHVVYNSNYEDH
jgi:hypothetical protein